MDKTENLEHRHNLFASVAVLAPMAQAASRESWPVVLGMAAAAWLLSRWCTYGKGWVLTVQRVWGCMLIGIWMQWSELFWQGLPFQSIVPLVLLVLGAWTVSVPGKAKRIGCVLLWPLLLLLGAVLLSGVPEVKLSYLGPVWQTPNLTLFAMMLLPDGWKRKRMDWKLPVGAVLVCMITTGVLSTPVSMSVPSGIYELSRSLSLLGMAERFESLIAAAMTMGFYGASIYLLEGPEGTKNKPWIYAGITVALYLIGVPENGWLLGAGGVFVWILLPRLFTEKIISEIGKKGIDKP